MMKPIVHLNGTSRDELFSQNFSALQAMNTTIAILQKAAPHSRDYYVHDNSAYNKAIAEFRERLIKLESVRDDLEQLCLHINGE